MTTKVEQSAVARFWEGFSPWAPYVGAGLALAAVYVAAQIEATQLLATQVIAFGAPVVAIASVLIKIGEAPPKPKRLVAITLLSALVLSLLVIGLTLFPVNKLASVAVSAVNLEASVQAPTSNARFIVYTRGSFISEGNTNAGKYSIRLTRGTTSRVLEGTVSQELGRTRRSMRGAPPTRVNVARQQTRHEVSLPGTGPITIHYERVDRQLRRNVDVDVLAYDPALSAMPWLFLILVLLAIYAESYIGAHHLPTAVTGAVGFSAVYATYLSRVFEPADPMSATFGGLIVALVVGAGVGFALGHVVSRWLVPKLESSP